MAEIDPEYERGFKDGLKSKIGDELMPMIKQVLEGISEAIKGLIPRMIDIMKIKANLDVNDWISCEEREPEADRLVLVACYGSDIIFPEEGETVEECQARLQRECVRVTLGFIGSDGWYDCEYSPMIIKPTYWMPLPEPPSIRTCPMTTYPTDCTDECKDCDCGGSESEK